MLEKITLKINETRELLNKAIEEKKSYSEIYRISVELDQLIVKYYQVQDKNAVKPMLTAAEIDNDLEQKQKIEKIKENVDNLKNCKEYEQDIPDERKLKHWECVYYFIKNRKLHKDFFNGLISKLLCLVFGACIIPNIIIDIMQKALCNNVNLWNIAFLLFTMIYNFSILTVTMKLKGWKHKLGIVLFVVCVSSMRYFWIMHPLNVVLMIILPLTICDMFMVYAYQFEFFNRKRNLVTSAIVSSVAKIAASYSVVSIMKLFIDDVFCINLLNNIFVIHQIIPILLATLITAYVLTWYVKKANIKIEKYNGGIFELVMKERKRMRMNNKQKIPTLIDY